MKVPNRYIVVNSAVAFQTWVIAVILLYVVYLIHSAPLSFLPQDVAVLILIGGVGLMALSMILLDLMVLHKKIERLTTMTKRANAITEEERK